MTDFGKEDSFLEMYDDLLGGENMSPAMKRCLNQLEDVFDRWEESLEREECLFMRQYISDYSSEGQESALNNVFSDMRGVQVDLMKRFAVMHLDEDNLSDFPDSAISGMSAIISSIPQSLDMSENEYAELNAFNLLLQKDRGGMEIPQICSKIEQAMSAHFVGSLIGELEDAKQRLSNNVVMIDGTPETWDFE